MELVDIYRNWDHFQCYFKYIDFTQPVFTS